VRRREQVAVPCVAQEVIDLCEYARRGYMTTPAFAKRGLSAREVSDSAPLIASRKSACLKLIEKYQEFNAFKFIVYGGEIDQAVAQ
jgi:hypothetical protein